MIVDRNLECHTQDYWELSSIWNGRGKNLTCFEMMRRLMSIVSSTPSYHLAKATDVVLQEVIINGRKNPTPTDHSAEVVHIGTPFKVQPSQLIGRFVDMVIIDDVSDLRPEWFTFPAQAS